MRDANALCQAAEDRLRQAHGLSENGLLIAEAATLYLQATDEDPGSARPYLGLALIRYALGDQALAVGLLMQAQSLEPHNLKVAQLLQRFQKKAPPPPPPKQAVRTLHPGVLSAQIAFDTPLVENPPALAEALPKEFHSDLGPAQRPGKVATGPEITLLQTTLDSLGYPVPASGQYDTATTQAVREFQRQQRLPLTGWVDAKTRAALNALLPQAQARQALLTTLEQIVHDYWAEQGYAPCPLWEALLAESWQGVRSQLQAEATPAPLPPPAPTPLITQALGSRGEAGVISSGPLVTQLQEILVAQGLPLKVSSQFDLDTLGALRRFLIQQGLPVQDRVDASNWEVFNRLLSQQYARTAVREALLSALSAWGEAAVTALKTAVFPLLEQQSLPPLTQELGPPGRYGKVSQGAAVGILQKHLQQAGYPCSLTLTFDTATQTALKAWQQSQNLPATGMADAHTLAHLNTQNAASSSSASR